MQGKKNWLVTKKERFEEVQQCLDDIGGNITVEAKQQRLGRAVGMNDFVTECEYHLVTNSVEQINSLPLQNPSRNAHMPFSIIAVPAVNLSRTIPGSGKFWILLKRLLGQNLYY